MANSVLNAAHFQNEEAAFAYVEGKLWPEGPVCPHCGNADAHRIRKMEGKTTRLGLYNCKECRKPFTVRQGTIFESSHLPLHLWLQVIHLMCASKNGISTRQIQRMLVCSMKTAWFLTHRIREAMDEGKLSDIGGLGGEGKVVEVDEAWIGGRVSNRVNGQTAPKKAVVSLIERDGRVASFHVPNVTTKTIRKIMGKHVSRKSALMTDESNVYTKLGREFASHQAVDHARREYAYHDRLADRWVGINTAEGFFSILKRGINGVYHSVSEAHLARYLKEFDFRYNHRSARGVEDLERADHALLGVKGKRLTYETTAQG